MSKEDWSTSTIIMIIVSVLLRSNDILHNKRTCMSKKINIEAIFKKHAKIYPDGKTFTGNEAKAAIKEIVEEVLKLAAKNAKAYLYYSKGIREGSPGVDKQSILDTNKQVEYE